MHKEHRMDIQTQQHLLDLHEALEKQFRAAHAQHEGIRQGLEAIMLFLGKIFLDSPFTDDVAELFDRMVFCLNQGYEEQVKAIEILEKIKMHWQGFNRAEITSVLLKREKQAQEQAQQIRASVAVRRWKQDMEYFFRAAYPPPHDLH